ncbi:MAG: dTMP kinase [Planctomycetes bacterium]|nr:dTMP kinase [Planctomycetota bacterium]
MAKGKFIVIDGLDGSGKTTQVKLLSRHLVSRGYPVVEIREPGSTALGEKIRRILLDRASRMSVETEMLLYMASRAQLVAEIIRPALAKNKIVIADRFTSATIAYQGYGGGLGGDKVKTVGQIAAGGAAARSDNGVPPQAGESRPYRRGGISPDLTIILDIKPEEGLKRIHEGRKDNNLDRIESRRLAFHKKVRQGFISLCRQERNYYLIDASKPVDIVHQQVIKIVDSCLRRK